MIADAIHRNNYRRDKPLVKLNLGGIPAQLFENEMFGHIKRFVAIEDTGRGIAPSVRANLFTPFFSAKGDRQGIGSALAQEMLDAHRFEFSLESQPGGPTVFTILFS